MEVEFVSDSSASHEGIWLRRFLGDLKVILHASNLVTLHCGSMMVIVTRRMPFAMLRPKT